MAENSIIEIEREERPARYTQLGPKFRWHVRGRPETGGISRQPLLDACRALQSLGELPATQISMFRPGRSEWDMRTTIGYGAGLTVVEETRDGCPRFGKWTPHPAGLPSD